MAADEDDATSRGGDERTTMEKKKRKRRRRSRAPFAAQRSDVSSTSADAAGTTTATETEASAEMSNSSGSKKKTRRKKKKVAPPKPGEEGYLTPTQLRNARKRRANKKTNKRRRIGFEGDDDVTGKTKEEGGNGSDDDVGANTVGRRSATDSKRRRRGGNVASDTVSAVDPSQRYLHDPKAAPIVRAAVSYFEATDPTLPFPVHLGPTRGWRTVSKLAVRRRRDNDGEGVGSSVAIGLFAPKSHEIVPVPSCPAHHPSVNGAVVAIEKACETIGVVPYDEQTGAGMLRYISINVERSTEKVQVTLVWNSAPYRDDKEKEEEEGGGGKDATGKAQLDRLVKALIAMGGGGGNDGGAKRKRRRGRKKEEEGNGTGNKESNDGKRGFESGSTPTFALHSLWVNYNASWKHSNAIFAYGDGNGVDGDGGAWKRVHGPESIVETLRIDNDDEDDSAGARRNLPSDVKLHFPPNVFRQANLDAFASIVGAVRNRVARFADEHRRNKKMMGRKKRGEIGGDKNDDVRPACVELYGGVGTLGLHVADLTSSFVSSDENPHNERCFARSRELLHAEVRERVSYRSKNAADMVSKERALLGKADVLLVDPPRKGLDRAVVDYLTTMATADGGGRLGPGLIAYVSCGFEAFQRDCDALLGSGLWRLEGAEGHLLFPGSDAIETLAFFVRK